MRIGSKPKEPSRCNLSVVRRRSIDLGLIPVHHFVSHGFDPLINLPDGHDRVRVEPIPAHGLMAVIHHTA
jgi:hypothetical protein